MLSIFKKKSKESKDDGIKEADLELAFGYGNNFTQRRAQGQDADEDNFNGQRNPALEILESIGIKSSLSPTIFYKVRPVSETEEIFGHICEYIRNGQEHGYGIKVKNILRIVRNGDFDFQHMPSVRDNHRMMLWHGTKTKVIASILKDGFKLPKPKKQMFGPGIYFADRASKSCNYCFNSRKNKKPASGTNAFLLLCDVMLGTIYNAKNAHNKLSQPPEGFEKSFGSVKCTGEKVPDQCFNKYFNNSVIPCGPTIMNTRFPSYSVVYNEYIVYNTEKVKIQFLVEVEFTAAPVLGEIETNNNCIANII